MIIFGSKTSFDDFQAHSGVMIRAFPEAGFIISAIGMSVLITAPIPFASFVVYDMFNNILPTLASNIERRLITKVLIEINVTYDAFAHHPPLALIINMPSVSPSFVYH